MRFAVGFRGLARDPAEKEVGSAVRRRPGDHRQGQEGVGKDKWCRAEQRVGYGGGARRSAGDVGGEKAQHAGQRRHEERDLDIGCPDCFDLPSKVLFEKVDPVEGVKTPGSPRSTLPAPVAQNWIRQTSPSSDELPPKPGTQRI